jgi:Uncharacterised protein family (UPF0203)
MGSAQSSTGSQNVDVGTRADVTNGDVNSSVVSVDATDPSNSTSMEYHDPNRPKEGMPLVHYVCRKKKKSYDKCVSQWYSNDFLTGNGSSLNQEDVCGSKFEAYRTCVLKGIKKEIWDKQNLPPPKEGSLLAEVANIVDDDEHIDK